jgi:hypothetical protein
MEERTMNCAINEQRILYMQKQIDEALGEIKGIKSQNITQNDLLTRFDLMITAINGEKEAQKEINKEFIHTLKSMNENLSLLNLDMGNVKKELGDLKDDQENIKTAQNKTKLDWLDLVTLALKNIITVGIGAGIVYLILAVS